MLRSLITRPAASDPGGVSVYTDSITSHFPENGIDFDFLEIGSTRGRFLHPLSDQLAFQRKIGNTEYDLVHINPSLHRKSFVRDGILTWQAKSRGLPLLVFFHGWSEDFETEVGHRWLWFFKATFGRADAFIVLASDFEKKLRQWGIQAPIYCETTAVNDDLISNFDIESKLNRDLISDECRVLFLARLERVKGIYETVDACALLIARNFRIHLVVAGDGPEAGKMRQYAEKKLGDNVTFTGYVRGDSKVTAFTDAHIYAMPTVHGEGLPVSVLEAMAFGLPVVTRPVGGLKDIFIDGKHGFMTESMDPAAIATLIEKMIVDQELWRKMCRNVHEYAKDNFVGSAVAEKIARIYKIIGENSNTRLG